MKLLDRISITFRFNPERGASDIYVNGDLVEGKIRTIEVSNCVSRVSAIPEVRRKLVAMQQEMGRRRGVVMDGRDIGTVVLPDAQVKIYLTASAEERTRRRMAEYEAKGLHADFEELLREVNLRDEQDRNRAVAPLRKAEDAVELDSTCMNTEEVLAAIETIVKERNA